MDSIVEAGIVMDHKEVGRMWGENAEAWTRLSRDGYDIYRDRVNTPAFMAMLPDVSGLSGLDIGCGEGHNTRLVAGRGAGMTAFDISQTFVHHALRAEQKSQVAIRYLRASAVEMPFPDASFDFAMATMSFMDAPEHDRIIAEAYRVLRPGGFLQFSMTHPCFQTSGWEWLLDEDGKRTALVVSDYFYPPEREIEEWIFGGVSQELQEELGNFRVPVFRRTLSSWINLLIESGFQIERMEEPHADADTIKRFPQLADTRIIAYFLIIRCRKPAR
jgi:ubiquinone/menaquinone biosynthesis C-methylase UbiE